MEQINKIKNLEVFLQECKNLAKSIEDETPDLRGIDPSKEWELQHYRLAVNHTYNDVRLVKAYVLDEQRKYFEEFRK